MTGRVLYTPAAPRWTTGDREALDQLWREGVLTVVQISQRLGRSKGAIKAEAKRRGLPPKQGVRFSKGA